VDYKGRGPPYWTGGRVKSENHHTGRILQTPAFLKYSLLVPVLVYLLFFFIYPLVKMFLTSCFDPAFTLRNYIRVYENPVYLEVIWITFRLSLIVTFLSLILGYPIAYLLNRLQPRVSQILMILVVLPFWTSILVRVYAWMVLLGRNGIINLFLMKMGLISTPLNLLFNTFSVTIGMVHFLLPFMVFPLYSVMNGIDKNLVKAAYNLGATPFKAFVRVFFPLSLPGVGAGLLIVFILAIGFFITPSLLGGRGDIVISMLIENQVNVQFNWPFASALGFVLLTFTLIIFNVSNRFLGIDRIWGGKI
jgi:putative spermidine/putrescine transport system permease protein